MDFLDYYKNYFQNDLGKIPFRNDILLHEDEPSRTFGDTRWGQDQIKLDLQNIEHENIEYFVLCLFTIILIDQNMHANFKKHYPAFRATTMYPKFAAISIKDVQAPKWILYRAEKEKLTNFSWTKTHVTEYIEYLILEAHTYFNKSRIPISADIFFNAMLKDKGFAISEDDKGTVYELIHNTLVVRLNKTNP